MLHFNTSGSEVMPLLFKSLLVLHVPLNSHLPCGMGLLGIAEIHAACGMMLHSCATIPRNECMESTGNSGPGKTQLLVV